MRRAGADAETSHMTNAHSTKDCPTCAGELLHVAIRMTDGAVEFWTCPSCELRWWVRDGAAIERTAALASIPRR
jgi:hypothetical protein